MAALMGLCGVVHRPVLAVSDAGGLRDDGRAVRLFFAFQGKFDGIDVFTTLLPDLKIRTRTGWGGPMERD
jgi:hypothetical protein